MPDFEFFLLTGHPNFDMVVFRAPWVDFDDFRCVGKFLVHIFRFYFLGSMLTWISGNGPATGTLGNVDG